VTSAAATQLVRPAGARHEARAIGIAAIAVLGIQALYVHERGRGDDHVTLHEWQVSAFETLTGADQAIYNALYTVKDEIPYLYDDINMMNAPGVKFRWPGIQDFQDALMPPFYQDRSWEQNGSLQWSLHEPLAEGEMQGSTMYLGTAGRAPGQGSFLLVIGHVHAGFTNNNSIVIWWNAGNRVAMPQSGFRDSLILQGWREVVPHSGAAEVERIFGDQREDTAASEDQQKAEQAIDDLFGK
jgi:hypothetical protein